MNAIKSLIAAVMNAAASRLQTPSAVDLPQFLGQHTHPENNERRQAVRAMGRRQYKKRMHAMRMAAKKGA